MSIFKGSSVAIVTPFNENGIDYKKLKELLFNTNQERKKLINQKINSFSNHQINDIEKNMTI